MESLKELRNKIDMAIYSNDKLQVNNTIARYHGLAGVELERANNWLTQLFHKMADEVYPSHEQDFQFPEEWNIVTYIEDNRKRIQDALNLVPKIPIKTNTQQMMASQVMTALMEAKMWLGNILDIYKKIEAVTSAQASLYVPEHVAKK